MATTYRPNCCPMPGIDYDHEDFNPPLPIGEKTNRVFNPSEHPEYGRATDPPSELIFYDSNKQVSHLRHSTSYAPFDAKIEADTLVISVDGKARGEGTTLAQVILARYFGPDSDWNGTSFFPRHTPQTAERATMVAATSAINKASMIIKQYPNIKKVIIMTHCNWLISHMHDMVWDWLAHGFPANEELPKGVSAEDYRLAHRDFRLLEEKNIPVLLWKVDEQLMPEPGRLANDYLDLLEHDVEAQREWEQGSEQYLFISMLEQMMRQRSTGDPETGGSGYDGRPCICPDCNPEAAKVAARESREQQWGRGEENDCPCDDCREFVRSHGGSKNNPSSMKASRKENERPDQHATAANKPGGEQTNETPAKKVNIEPPTLDRFNFSVKMEH